MQHTNDPNDTEPTDTPWSKLRRTVRSLRQNGTPEGIAAAIGRARDAQLDMLRAAGEPIPPTIREMDAATESDVVSNLTDQERDQMIAENVASIEAVPQAVWERIPAGQAISREWALFWARRGYDCYACRGFGEHRVWNVWLAGERIELGREPTA